MSVSAKQWLFGLRSWKLFMLAVTLFFMDLLVPDPPPLPQAAAAQAWAPSTGVSLLGAW